VNCREVLARLYEYLDTELDESDRKSVDSHLEFCSDCLKKYQLEEEFNKVIKSKCASQTDVANLKSRVLSEIEKIDRVGKGSAGPRNLLFLLAPLAAAVIITLIAINPWNSNSKGSNLVRFGPVAAEHSKCLGNLKDFIVESADPQKVHEVMAKVGVLPDQLFSTHNGEVTLLKGGVAHTTYGSGPHLDYQLEHGNVSLIALPIGQIDKSGLDKAEHDGIIFYFGSCPKYQYVVWEWQGEDLIAISELDPQKLMGFVTTF